jgi:hypothetical protein
MLVNIALQQVWLRRRASAIPVSTVQLAQSHKGPSSSIASQVNTARLEALPQSTALQEPISPQLTNQAVSHAPQAISALRPQPRTPQIYVLRDTDALLARRAQLSIHAPLEHINLIPVNRSVCLAIPENTVALQASQLSQGIATRVTIAQEAQQQISPQEQFVLRVNTVLPDQHTQETAPQENIVARHNSMHLKETAALGSIALLRPRN